MSLLPGSFHLSFFVFRQFWRRSYQNQLSFSGKDSTADFFVFRQNDEKRKSKDEMNPALVCNVQNNNFVMQQMSMADA